MRGLFFTTNSTIGKYWLHRGRIRVFDRGLMTTTVRQRGKVVQYNENNDNMNINMNGVNTLHTWNNFTRQQRQRQQRRRQLNNVKTISSSPSSSLRPGLFSLPGLHSPSDFQCLVKEAIRTANELRSELRSSDNISDDPNETLSILDSISNIICTIVDASELCRNVHPSSEWRLAAERTFDTLSSYIAELNVDTHLHSTIISIANDNKAMIRLDEEGRRMVVSLRDEFEREGIGLCNEKREKVLEAGGNVVELESMFLRNITEAHAHNGDNNNNNNNNTAIGGGTQLWKFSRKEVEKVIPSSYLPPSSTDDDFGNVHLNTDPRITGTILQHSPSTSLRREAHYAANTTCPQNLDVLSSLLQARHVLSQLTNHQSYGHRYLEDKMVKSPKNVDNFLNLMAKGCHDSYSRDMKLLMEIKRRSGGDVVSTDANNALLEPCDVRYYSGMAKEIMMDGFDVHSQSWGYFTVDRTLNGLRFLVRRLFGIIMEEVPFSEGEGWWYDDNNNGTGGTSVRKYNFRTEGEGDVGLGTVYLDLHPREAKYPHAAHFTVRCGCRSTRRRNDEDNDNNDGYQLPIVALVCSFSPPTPTSTSSTTATSLISHGELETLLHEFGHALHSLLSRTTYQHLSGTRASIDFIETPSHLMERYACNPYFLQLIGRHYTTGERLEKDVIRKIVGSKDSLRAIDVQSQVMYGRLDQALHRSSGPLVESSVPSSSPSTSTTTTSSSSLGKWDASSTTKLLKEMHLTHGVPYAEGTHWHSSFGHLVSYGAGYYAYLYAGVFSADIHDTLFSFSNKYKRDGGEDDFLMIGMENIDIDSDDGGLESGGVIGGDNGSGSGSGSGGGGYGYSDTVFDRTTGMRYWQTILAHGGAKDPNVMLQELLGREPSVNPFFRGLGGMLKKNS